MLNINLVPDDYIQNNEARRINIMCLVLFVPVVVVLAGLLAFIRIQQRVLVAREKLIDTKMERAHEAIMEFEQLQEKRDAVWKRAMATAELLEPVSRSVLLASLINNLPPGVSFLQLSAVQKEPPNPRSQATQAAETKTNKYEKERAKKAAAAVPARSQEKLLRMHIDIEGIAPSDLEVAAYIERLSGSKLLENVTLVESKEFEAEDTKFRHFRLTAMLKRDIHLADEDIDKIRTKL
jgi:Tfp pilus assembly protein PilN